VDVRRKRVGLGGRIRRKGTYRLRDGLGLGGKEGIGLKRGKG
jgi:hypothetical protein